MNPVINVELKPVELDGFFDALNVQEWPYNFHVESSTQHLTILALQVDGGALNNTTLHLLPNGTWKLFTDISIGPNS